MKYEYRSITYECKHCDVKIVVNTDYDYKPLCPHCKRTMQKVKKNNET